MTLIDRLKSIYANPNHKLISLIWLFAAFLCVVGTWHEASLLKFRSDVEGILLGMNTVAILSILGSAYSVLFYGYRQTVRGILIPLLTYVLVYMALREVGDQMMDEVAKNPEKWIMFVVGALLSRAIFKAWRGTGEGDAGSMASIPSSRTSWPNGRSANGHQANIQEQAVVTDERSDEADSPR